MCRTWRMRREHPAGGGSFVPGFAALTVAAGEASATMGTKGKCMPTPVRPSSPRTAAPEANTMPNEPAPKPEPKKAAKSKPSGGKRRGPGVEKILCWTGLVLSAGLAVAFVADLFVKK